MHVCNATQLTSRSHLAAHFLLALLESRNIFGGVCKSVLTGYEDDCFKVGMYYAGPVPREPAILLCLVGEGF